MSARILKADLAYVDQRMIDEIAGVVKEGGVIVYPTDTIYGLGCDPSKPDAVEKVFLMKHRPSANPALLLINEAAMLNDLVASIPTAARKLVERHWPGPLTIVFEARRQLHPYVTPADRSIAIRLPANEFCLRVIAASQAPLVSTSANISGRRVPGTIGEIERLFSSVADLIVNAGDMVSTIPSTVVDVRGGKVVVVREGKIPRSELEE